jgi:antitoxin (DNA-binding transcriptional repressor) of toxin-antitoxin stability system
LQMAIYNSHMDISVTEFKHRCLAIIRSLEKTGNTVTITRRGKPVAQLDAPVRTGTAAQKPWESLRSRGGRLLAAADESVLRDKDFEALR